MEPKYTSYTRWKRLGRLVGSCIPPSRGFESGKWREGLCNAIGLQPDGTWQAIADKIGVPVSTLVDVAAGKVGNPPRPGGHRNRGQLKNKAAQAPAANRRRGIKKRTTESRAEAPGGEATQKPGLPARQKALA